MPSELTSSIGRFGLIAAGGYAFGPIGAAAGALLGSFLFGSSGPDIEGPRLGDLDVSSSTYGGVIPLGFGVQKVAGTIIWATDIEEEKRKRTEGEGIFGWGGQDVTEYFYYGNFAVAFGEGPAVDVLRLWAGSKLIFDRRDPVAAMPEGWSGPGASLFTGNSKYKYKIHLGTEDQEPDGLIVRKVLEETGEADAVPAHRGLVYIVFDRLPLAEWNNRIPPITAEIAWSGARPATVRNATFLPHDGGTSFQRSGMTVDFARGYIYLEGNGGMHRIRTSDMQEDLHVGAEISPVLVDSKGNIYSTGLTTIQKFSGSSYALLATAGGQSDPKIDLMWGYAPLGWRRDFLLVMNQFGDCHIRVADLQVSVPGARDLAKLWDGQDISARRHGCVAGATGVGTCEGWFVGNHSITGGQTATTPILHVEVTIELAISLLQAFGSIGQTGVKTTSITLAAADFGKSTMSVSAPAYDQQNDRLLLTAVFDDSTRHLISYGKDDGIVWSRPINSGEALPDQARFTGGKIYTYAGGTAYIRDAADGALLSSHGSFAAGVGIAGRMLFDESATTFYMTGTSAVHQVIAHRAIPGSMPLADIVTALCLRTGLAEADLDVSELTDGVRGYALARQVSVRGALEMLAAAYTFDAVESDHQLKFKKRGRSPSRVLPEQDLVPVNAEREAFIETRAQEVDLPLRFTVVYQDLERDADIGTQYAKRVAGPSSAMYSQNEATFDLPLTLTAPEAKGIALRQLHSAWLERTGYEWHLPWTHVDLEPADVVQVALDDGTLLNIRILETELGANLELAWKTVLEEKSSYEAVPVTQGGIGYRRVSNVYGSEARLFVMDIPLLEDADDVGRVLSGLYWGAGAYGAPWPACVLFQSEDGTIYAAADTALAAVTWGAAVNVLGPTATPFQTDLVNTLEIALVGGDAPESVTAEEMLADANRAAVIRADGSAEIIHFQDVIATDAGTYVLSTLLRGRRGTEVFVPGHEPGEMFVMLDDSAAVLRRLLPLDRVGKTLHLVALARGGDAGNSTPQVIQFGGNDLKPYAPVHLAASGSFGADITLSWVRRTRVGGDLKDGFGTVLLAEDTEEYELEILGPDDEVRRTVTDLTSLSFTYTAAMQAVDFPEGYPASAFVVYQLSAQVGRGFAARLDFPDAPQFATLGEDIAEGQAGSGTSNFPASTVMAQRYTGIAGQVLSASAYLGSSATGNMRIGLYADNAGEPGALIATTEEKGFTATSAGHWEELTFSSPPTTLGGVKYWLACHADASVNSRGSDGSNQNDARRMITQSYASGLPDPFGAGSSYSNSRGLKMRVWTNP